MNLLDYLSSAGVDFTVMHHEEYYTAQEEAAAQGLSGHVFAKTVVVCAGDERAAGAPRLASVDLERVEQILNTDARMVTGQMKSLFPDCEVGAEPPFGSQFGLRTLVDEHLAQQERTSPSGW